MRNHEKTSLSKSLIHDPELLRLLALEQHVINTFEPRPDRPEKFDEQTSFVNSQSVVSVLLGGNGSGKTTAAAYKVAKFLLHQQKPGRRDTPFWVISDSLWQVSEICWKQGLEKFIPAELIDWERVKWQSAKLDCPSHVPLKPWPGTRHNWMIEFRSTESGRAKFQGVSLGGAWFSEQFEWSILEETMRGLRDTWYPGSVVLEMTPINPDLSIELEVLYDDPPNDWAFFRLNTECNDAVDENWKKSFFASVSEEMQETRKKGTFASFQGVIYQSFNPKIHLVGDDVICHPNGVYYRRGIDWGESSEHPFVILWGYKDGSGNWYIFDEFVDYEGILYEQRCEIIKERHEWPSFSPNFGVTFADPSRPGLINELNARGIPTQSARNSVHPGIEHIRNMLKVLETTGQPKLFIHHKNCPILARQMRTYRWLRSSGKGLNPQAARHEPLKKNDDTCDALRYMIFSESILNDLVPSSEKIKRKNRQHGVRLERLRDKFGREQSWVDAWNARDQRR